MSITNRASPAEGFYASLIRNKQVKMTDHLIEDHFEKEQAQLKDLCIAQEKCKKVWEASSKSIFVGIFAKIVAVCFSWFFAKKIDETLERHLTEACKDLSPQDAEKLKEAVKECKRANVDPQQILYLIKLIHGKAQNTGDFPKEAIEQLLETEGKVLEQNWEIIREGNKLKVEILTTCALKSLPNMKILAFTDVDLASRKVLVGLASARDLVSYY